MRDETWQALDDMFSRSPMLKAESVASEEIATAEADLGFTLSDDYQQFIRRYGGGIVGPFPIFGLRRTQPMGKREGSFVEVTRAFRRKHWPGTEQWAVISMDHAGNPVGLDEGGRVWISDHDARAVQPLASSFEDYLRKWCLRLPD